jgi:CubicO group peptidase (beta-lactamase class C family)
MSIQRIATLSFGILLVSQTWCQESRVDRRFAGLDTAFSRVLKLWHAAGFAVAVVDKDKVIYSRGFGFRNLESRAPVTTRTLFPVGSCTKAFTASLLGQLRQGGKVDFDKPVRTYLPVIQFYRNDMNDNITLRDMMCHRTGLPRHDFSWYYFASESRDSLLQRIQYMEPSAGIREKWQYNNFMFLLQGMVVEKLTGTSWETNVREKLFRPLQMNQSNFTIEDMLASGEAARGYSVKNDTVLRPTEYFHIDAMGPAGSINSNVTDMANWVITWINGGRFQGREILPSSYVSEAISSQMIVGNGLPDKERKDIYFSTYGLGWFLASYRGHYRVEHGGNIDGFSASTCFFPTDSIGIIVLSNQDGSAVPLIVRNLLADRLLGLKYIDWNTDLKSNANKQKLVAKDTLDRPLLARPETSQPSHPLNDYTGNFVNKAYGIIEFSVLNDSLFATVGQHTWWLKHLHYDVFEPFDKDPKEGIDTAEKSNPILFQMNQAGEIESASLNLEPTVPPILFTREKKTGVTAGR